MNKIFIGRNNKNINIIYIAGYGRSGSTLLERILNCNKRLKMGRVGHDYVIKHHIWDQLVELILGDVDL